MNSRLLALCCSCTLLVLGVSCKSEKQQQTLTDTATNSEVQIVGAMRNVMWKGELGPAIVLDSLNDKAGLYGIGPLSYLQGELLINDGKSYISRVLTDSTMQVVNTFDASAPFFVYGQVQQWNKIEVPDQVKDLKSLEAFLVQQTQERETPFVFKIKGQAESASIHIQNLPEGTKVSSPAEAHQGQTNYELADTAVEIVGFFSKKHQGVFTHHDTFMHLHLITSDETQMGHLDAISLGDFELYLPQF
ncbi:acetolactate decarboxylase [Gilvibacter sediminis]|uniref:acetolactate decarboxylase n=1 Tax=Gilvibacter sediminis TaxID=379071 RepID=UPI00235060C5|nr:acetolactate decarboxylase [Gilvibacter sediminis]MDC7998942.1 acetolactate decarboxylase [Gilvibacter sediminis]